MQRRTPRAILLAMGAAVGLAACGLPRDSDGTLDRIRGGSMRVGVVVDTPWITDSTPEPGGIEAALVRALARDAGARIQWVRAPESELLETLHRRELDLVVGGISATSPWAKQLAMTRPFYVDTVAVAGVRGQQPPTTLDGITVAVREGDPVAGAIRKKGGKPTPVASLDSVASAIVAAPSWKLAQLGRSTSRRMMLEQHPHVFAAAPGENAWLVRIERTLFAHRDSVGTWLRRAP